MPKMNKDQQIALLRAALEKALLKAALKKLLSHADKIAPDTVLSNSEWAEFDTAISEGHAAVATCELTRDGELT